MCPLGETKAALKKWLIGLLWFAGRSRAARQCATFLSVKGHDTQRLCFCSGAFPKPRPVPRNQTWNEDKNL